MTVSPKVYLILGFDDSGRRAILTDFIDSIGTESPILYFRHKDEVTSDSDTLLENLNQVSQLGGADGNIR